MRLARATTVLGAAAVLLLEAAACSPQSYPSRAPAEAPGPQPGSVVAGAPSPDAFTLVEQPKSEIVEPATSAAENRATEAVDAFPPVVRFGSGEFIKASAYRQLSQARSAPQPGIGEGYTLNFANADIREVVRAVLGDILQLNYAIDPGLAGEVTLQSSRPLSVADLLPTLESVLRLNGAALVVDGGLYKVVMLEGATRTSAPIHVSPVGAARVPGYGVEAIPLSFVAAREMAKILEPFATEGSVVSVDSSRNLLLVAGTPEERAAVVDAVEIFDVDWLSGTSFGVFPLDNAEAESVAEELGIIFGSAQNESLQDLVRFVPVQRLNAILVISLQPRYLEEARSWIGQLDRSSDGASPRVFVRFIENQRASELAQVLGQAFGAQTQTVVAASLGPDLEPGSVEADAMTGTVTGAPVPAGHLLPPPPGDGIVARGAKEIRIIAVDSTNSLVILATPQDYRMIEQAIEELDVLPLQVLIEATILEVTLNDALEFGVQWFLDSGRSEFTLSDFADGAVATAFPGFSWLYRNTADVRIVVNALSEITDVNVVSSPQLLVLDNQSAELQVGDEVPIATQSAVSVGDPDAPIVNSIEFRDTGVILRVTPRVNKGGLVLLDIEQEVSSVIETTTSGIDSPTIRQRRITSTVAIQSGETVALGGLIREEATRTSSGVPFLSELPVLGFVFGSRGNDQNRTELLVLITPRVVRNQREARDVTDELRRRIKAIEPLSILVE